MKITFWLKIYIIFIMLVGLTLITLNLKAQTNNANLNFCSKTETINLNTPRIVNCNVNYHIEGNDCVANTRSSP